MSGDSSTLKHGRWPHSTTAQREGESNLKPRQRVFGLAVYSFRCAKTHTTGAFYSVFGWRDSQVQRAPACCKLLPYQRLGWARRIRACQLCESLDHNFMLLALLRASVVRHLLSVPVSAAIASSNGKIALTPRRKRFTATCAAPLRCWRTLASYSRRTVSSAPH